MSIDGTLSFQADSHGSTFKRSGRGWCAPPPPPALANRMLVEKRLLDEMTIDGSPFFKACSHGSRRMIGFLEKLDEGKKCPLTARCPFKQIRII